MKPISFASKAQLVALKSKQKNQQKELNKFIKVIKAKVIQNAKKYSSTRASVEVPSKIRYLFDIYDVEATDAFTKVLTEKINPTGLSCRVKRTHKYDPTNSGGNEIETIEVTVDVI